jgi:hypothetical protein
MSKNWAKNVKDTDIDAKEADLKGPWEFLFAYNLPDKIEEKDKEMCKAVKCADFGKTLGKCEQNLSQGRASSTIVNQKRENY